MAKRKNYESHKADAAERSREKSASGREIGPLPAVLFPARKAAAGESLRVFCETYFPRRFRLGWGDMHLKALARLEACARNGSLYALAMPRGSGKSTLAECAALWAILFGIRRFVVLIAATEKAAERTLKKLKAEIEGNPLLAKDFPEACYPVKMLEGIHNRAKGQTLDGERTRIGWTADGIVLPTVAGSPCSGSIVRVGGLTGAIRGLSEMAPDGEPIRPDFVILDDPQTRESAKSPTQTHDRESIILGDILGLAGPDTTIAAVMPCTVIYPGDLADRFLNTEERPEWHGERTPMLLSFPERLDLWERYKEIRDESLTSGASGESATEFYAANQAEMDAGAVASWPDRKKPGELSAIESAMILHLTNPREFAAEYQSKPLAVGGAEGAKELKADNIAQRLNGLDRCTVPRESTRLTTFIDVGNLLWYTIMAWDNQFGGSVIDYGTWPRQSRAMFAAADAKPGLEEAYPNLSETQRVYAGLRDLTGEILGRAYYREQSGEEMRIERCLIDCGWQAATVHTFCRQSPHSATIYASKGIARTTTGRGVSEWKSRPGERSGFHWRLTLSESGKGRMVQFDPDAWKTFIYERLVTAMGGAGAITLFGKSAKAHEMIAEHCAAEYACPVTIRGTTFDKWQVLPSRPDNHLWDCIIGNAVAGSVAGASWSPTNAPADPVKPRPKLKLSELYAKKHGRG